MKFVSPLSPFYNIDDIFLPYGGMDFSLYKQKNEGLDALTPHMNLEEAFGQAVRLKRRDAGLNQDELAELLDLQQAAISRLENGHVSATLDMVGRVAAALHTTPSALLQDAQNLPGYVPMADGRPRRIREAD